MWGMLPYLFNWSQSQGRDTYGNKTGNMTQTKPFITHENRQARRVACMRCRKRAHLYLMLPMNCSRTLHPWSRISSNSVKGWCLHGLCAKWLSGRKLTVSGGYFKDEWEHKTYFVLFSTLNMSLEQNLYLKWNGEMWFLWVTGFFFFSFHTLTEQKHLEEDSPMSRKYLYICSYHGTQGTLWTPSLTECWILFKLCHHTPMLSNS